MQKIIRKEIEIASRKLVLETGRLAGHADGAVVASLGETVVLATVVAREAPENVDFFPLAVDYEEKLYAGGKIHTSRFIKREGRPSEEAILTARLVDRSIRPLFPKDYQAEVQVIITVLSVDQENDPDIVALIAASAALTISNIPWNGPIAGVRVGHINGDYILNPVENERSLSTLDLVAVTTKDEIVMIEADAKEVEESSVAEAIKFACANSKQIIELIESLAHEAGRPKDEYESQRLDPEVQKAVVEFINANIIGDLKSGSSAQDEKWFSQSLEKLEGEFIKPEGGSLTSKELADVLDEEVANFLREQILTKKKRIDGRAPDEIRLVGAQVGLLPRTHGSGLFERGETQVLSVVTLGSPALEQLIEGMLGEGTKRYIHHYNFPPFSAGEVRRLGAPGRREIGHGALAERALLPVIPKTDDFPYTIRVVSEVLSSAGSTSMASTCGSTLALMDAGVPIKELVAGISIGLIIDKKDKSKYVLLTDIAYQEDSQGDMDFKVAGTKNGITVIQMDVKLSGISEKIAGEALAKAKIARLAILEKIKAVISEPRGQISKFAPTVILVKIDPSKIGEVIGSGGRTINKIIAATGCAIDVNDEGTVTISGRDPAAAKRAAAWIEGIVKEIQPGEVYDGKVTRILSFGAMVEILPGKEGLVNISQLAPYRVGKVEDIVKTGQEVHVRVTDVDDLGRVNLSMLFGQDADQGGQQNHGFGARRFDRPRPRGRQDRSRPHKRY